MAKTLKLARPLMFALTLSLVACTPDGYTKSPALAEYFAKLIPGAYVAGVDVVAECWDGRHRSVSVLFENGNLYHYNLDMVQSTFVFDFMTTKASRAVGRKAGETMTLGCIGTYQGAWADTYFRTGDYRFIVHKNHVTAQVDDEILINRTFNDELKAWMGVVAHAANDAIQQDKHFVPPQTSWGVEL
jgi:hypothetical protein